MLSSVKFGILVISMPIAGSARLVKPCTILLYSTQSKHVRLVNISKPILGSARVARGFGCRAILLVDIPKRFGPRLFLLLATLTCAFARHQRIFHSVIGVSSLAPV